jgi:hypothetical protein
LIKRWLDDDDDEEEEEDSDDDDPVDDTSDEDVGKMPGKKSTYEERVKNFHQKKLKAHALLTQQVKIDGKKYQKQLKAKAAEKGVAVDEDEAAVAPASAGGRPKRKKADTQEPVRPQRKKAAEPGPSSPNRPKRKTSQLASASEAKKKSPKTAEAKKKSSQQKKKPEVTKWTKTMIRAAKVSQQERLVTDMVVWIVKLAKYGLISATSLDMADVDGFQNDPKLWLEADIHQFFMIQYMNAGYLKETAVNLLEAYNDLK